MIEIRKSLLLFLVFILILLLFYSCDPCNYNEVSLIPEGDVYFTALPANSNQPSIFQINLSNKTTYEIIKNGILFSAPSFDKKFVFLRNNINGGQDIVVSNINGSNQRVIAGNFSWQIRNFAIISPKGQIIAIGANNNELWLLRNEDKAYRLSSNFCRGTLPAFSPDGSKIAFFEGKDIYSQMKITTYFVDTDVPFALGSKALEGSAIELFGDIYPSWSPDGEFVFFPRYSLNFGDILYIYRYDLKTYSKYIVTVSGCFNAITSAGLRFVYLTGRDGILWRRDISDTIYPRVKVISPSYGVSYNVFQDLSPNETKIIYTRYYRDDKAPFRGTLEIANLTDSIFKPKILVNNVFRGFWIRKF